MFTTEGLMRLVRGYMARVRHGVSDLDALKASGFPDSVINKVLKYRAEGVTWPSALGSAIHGEVRCRACGVLQDVNTRGREGRVSRCADRRACTNKLERELLIERAKEIVRAARKKAAKMTRYEDVKELVAKTCREVSPQMTRAGRPVTYVEVFYGIFPRLKSEVLPFRGACTESQRVHCAYAFGCADYVCQTCGAFKLSASVLCVRCTARSADKKARIKATKDANGGNGFANARLRRKACKTMRERLGVSWAAQNPATVKKMKVTNKARYGHESAMQNAEVIEKAKATFRDTYEKRGGEIRAKYETTMRKNHGKDWMRRATQAMIKARYKHYDVVLCGKIYSVQGYEPDVIEELIAQGVQESNIVPYGAKCRYADGNKVRLYTPDILIKKHQLIIEVKSAYTAGLYYENMWIATKKKLAAAAASFPTHDVVLAVHTKGRPTVFIANAHTLTYRGLCRAAAASASLKDAVPRLAVRNRRARISDV